MMGNAGSYLRFSLAARQAIGVAVDHQFICSRRDETPTERRKPMPQ
jgi:hypothetical protein